MLSLLATNKLGCPIGFHEDAWTHNSDNHQVGQKKSVKTSYTHLDSRPNFHFMYTNDFLQIHNGREKISPSKRATRDSSRYRKLAAP